MHTAVHAEAKRADVASFGVEPTFKEVSEAELSKGLGSGRDVGTLDKSPPPALHFTQSMFLRRLNKLSHSTSKRVRLAQGSATEVGKWASQVESSVLRLPAFKL